MPKCDSPVKQVETTAEGYLLILQSKIQKQAKKNLKIATGGKGRMTLPISAKSVNTREELSKQAKIRQREHGKTAPGKKSLVPISAQVKTRSQLAERFS